jgi:hypothetical protein
MWIKLPLSYLFDADQLAIRKSENVSGIPSLAPFTNTDEQFALKVAL